ncbi:MAG: hypothetical protein OXT72_15610, partial [Gammaproteobacteria bacterium]|nr:hypothetical protein [Gammaproteobacteria bacterium]MDE0248228.1 hypothetical protein [Gammaproteobacteria bacterium]
YKPSPSRFARSLSLIRTPRSRAIRQRPPGTLGAIGLQCISESRADGNEAGLEELGVAYGQQCIVQVDIVEREAQCLAQTQPRAIKKQEQRAQGVGIEPVRAPPTDIDGAEQSL